LARPNSNTVYIGLEELKKLLDELDASDEEVVLQKCVASFLHFVTMG
jgi:hypothetical protein